MRAETHQLCGCQVLQLCLPFDILNSKPETWSLEGQQSVNVGDVRDEVWDQATAPLAQDMFLSSQGDPDARARKVKQNSAEGAPMVRLLGCTDELCMCSQLSAITRFMLHAMMQMDKYAGRGLQAVPCKRKLLQPLANHDIHIYLDWLGLHHASTEWARPDQSSAQNCAQEHRSDIFSALVLSGLPAPLLSFATTRRRRRPS